MLYSHECLTKIDCTDIENLRIDAHLITGDIIRIEGLEAIELAMSANPSIIEGKRFSFSKGAWIVHNLIGHPLMQLFALCRLYRFAIWIHDKTIPKPKGKYQNG